MGLLTYRWEVVGVSYVRFRTDAVPAFYVTSFLPLVSPLCNINNSNLILGGTCDHRSRIKSIGSEIASLQHF